MVKLLHLHTDYKFLFTTTTYVHPDLANEIVFIGDISPVVTEKLVATQLPFTTVSTQNQGLTEVLRMADAFEAVVIHDLCSFKAMLVSKLPSALKVFIRPFGYELYRLRRRDFVSPLTWYYCSLGEALANKKKGIIQRLRAVKDYFTDVIKESDESLIDKAFSRADRVMMYNHFEYEELSAYFRLPKYLQIPLGGGEIDLSNEKNKILIIGNSRNSWNNHLEVLELIKSAAGRAPDLKYLLFLNYGPKSSYFEQVLSVAQALDNTIVQENFLSMADFKNLYKTSSALIINSYRQHALGNIFSAIRFGCKLYLSERNSTYRWLKDEGFYISEIDDLRDDLLTGDVLLSSGDQQHNIDCYLRVQAKYDSTAFVEEIVSIIRG